MKIVIAISLFILGLLKRRSKPVFFLILIGMWFLMIDCGETLDSQNYINEFNNITFANATKEPLYVLIVYFFKNIGLNYNTYHALSSSIIIMFIGWATYKMAHNYNLVLCLFLVYPFALYVVQIRNCIAFSLCMIAFTFLMRNDDKIINKGLIDRKKNEILYVILILCASFIHSAYLFFLVFLIAKKIEMKKVIVFTAVALIVESIILNKTILLNIAGLFNVRSRLEYYFYFQNLNGQSDISLRIIITFIMYLCLFGYFILNKKHKNNTNEYIGLRVYNQNMLTLKINIMCMLIIPIVPLIREIFRIQEALMLLNYITITNNMDLQKTWVRDTINNWLVIALLLFVIMTDNYLYILRFNQMVKYVTKAVFG